MKSNVRPPVDGPRNAPPNTPPNTPYRISIASPYE